MTLVIFIISPAYLAPKALKEKEGLTGYKEGVKGRKAMRYSSLGPGIFLRVNPIVSRYD